MSRQKTKVSKPSIGLVRHAGTEKGGSQLLVYQEIESVVARRYPVVTLPSLIKNFRRPWQRKLWSQFFKDSDLVIGDAHSGSPYSDLFRMRSRLKGHRPPIIYQMLGEMPRGAWRIRSVYKHLRSCDRLLFSSTPDYDIFTNIMSSTVAHTTLLPFFVDTQRFKPMKASERQSLRTKLGYRPNDVVFLYVGRITAEKNVHTSMRLLRNLVHRRPNVRFLIVGLVHDVKFYEFDTGPFDLTSVFDALLKNDPVLSQRVLMIPAVKHDELSAIYGIGDIFINLTLHHDENFGFANVEAMSCGLPVIGTDWGGLKDSIDHGETGFRVDTVVTNWGIRVDEWQTSNYCERLARDRQIRQKLGRAGRRRVIERFTRQIFEKKLLAEIESALHAPKSESRADNDLTELGRSLNLHLPKTGTYSRPIYDLYTKLIGPYATRPVCTSLTEDAPLSLSSLSIELTDNSIELGDPLWPGKYRISDLDRSVIAILEENLSQGRPFVYLSEFREKLAAEAWDSVLQSITYLLGNGIVSAGGELNWGRKQEIVEPAPERARLTA